MRGLLHPDRRRFDPAREELQRQIAPRLAAHGSKVSMDPRLFDRVEAISQDMDGLSPEDLAPDRTDAARPAPCRRRADGAARDRMAAIRERLAVLSTDFAQNVLTDERDFNMAVPDDGLAGLPDWLIRSMRAAARERGLSGQVVTLSRSLIVPFLEYAMTARCAKPRGGHGRRGATPARGARKPTTAPSRLKSCACAMNVRSFWAMPISPATSLSRKWPAMPPMSRRC